MAGGSYFGATQWRAASEAPEALKAVVPYVTAADYHEGWAYQGGAFELGFGLHWTLAILATGEVVRRLGAGQDAMADLAALVQAVDDNAALYERLPLTDVPLVADLAPYYLEWLAHPDYDDYWRRIAPTERYGEITVPALNVGGWYDLFLGGTIANYVGMKDHGATPAAGRPPATARDRALGPRRLGGLVHRAQLRLREQLPRRRPRRSAVRPSCPASSSPPTPDRATSGHSTGGPTS